MPTLIVVDDEFALDNTSEKYRMRSLIALLFLLAAPVCAQNHDNGLEMGHSAGCAASLSACRQMAENGETIAQYNLGVVYEYGRGVTQNDVEAINWYRRASVRGMSAAQYKLGIMYDNGWGVAASDIEAVKWYSKAAEQGHTFAQHDLAFMYATGTGVSQDYVRAYMWLSVALASGNSLMTKHLDRVSGKLSFAQIEEAQKMAREWMENSQ